MPPQSLPPYYFAEVAYNAYCKSRNWKAYNGDKLPLFNDTKEEIREGWKMAADAVANAFGHIAYTGVLPPLPQPIVEQEGDGDVR